MNSIQNILLTVKEKTGIESALYSAFGEIIFSTTSRDIGFSLPAADLFKGNVASCDGRTYLRVHQQSGNFYVVLIGDGKESENYAFFIETLIGNDEERFRNDMDVSEKLRLLFAGELSSVQRNMLRAYFSDVKFNHFMLSLVTASADMQPGLKQFLSTVADKRDYIVPMDERTIVFFRYVSEDSDEYRSANEFASILYENIKEELRIDLIISTGGTIRSFHELVVSYEKVIFTYKFGRLLNPGCNVYSYKDYVLIRLLSDIPKPLLIKYFDGLIEKNGNDVISDEELMDTAEEFMKNSLNISETSRNMYIHRNTLIYRLDKIEKEMGLNLRNFSDAITFRLINILNTLIKGE